MDRLAERLVLAAPARRPSSNLASLPPPRVAQAPPEASLSQQEISHPSAKAMRRLRLHCYLVVGARVCPECSQAQPPAISAESTSGSSMRRRIEPDCEPGPPKSVGSSPAPAQSRYR